MTSDPNPANTPLLLIAWRRPHTLRQVIDAIRPVAPTRLYVACDGPNPERPGEAEKVAATRAVIEHEIDWPCQIERLYSDVNQGCRLGVSRAITWFFEQVEEGIILEDDCVPNLDFFRFCAELLERYRNDSRIWCISGTNFQSGLQRGDASYYFSRYPNIWGWATWRRCWHHYDVSIQDFPEMCRSGTINHLFANTLETRQWVDIWSNIFAHNIDTWDGQWSFACKANGALAIHPNSNLISNVGFDSDAAHTFYSGSNLNESTSFTLDSVSMTSSLHFPLRHPKFIVPNLDADSFEFTYKRGGIEMEKARSTSALIRRKLRSALSLIRISLTNRNPKGI